MAKRLETLMRESYGLAPKKQSKTIRYEMIQKIYNKNDEEKEKAQRAERIEVK